MILNRAVRGHLTQALRDVRDGRVGLRGESIPGGRTIPCKGPEAGKDRGVGQRDGDKTGEQLGAERVGPRRPCGDLGVYSDEDRSRCRV